MLDPKTFSSQILSWYDINKRELPWRSDSPDPYAVWISEIMLQQTTVPAVISYYTRWLTRFPDINQLADSSIDDVLQLWAGLGYYSRARNIHKAAEIIAEQFGGKMPSDVSDLMKLPGIGRYTAGAIASIAFGRREAVVDANARRILARVAGQIFEGEEPFEQRIWCFANQLIPDQRAGDYNQALMDLASSVCTVKQPHCEVCPVQNHCAGYHSGNPESLPGQTKAKKWNVQTHISFAFVHDGYLLLAKRSDEKGQWWAGMWELPRVALKDGETTENAAVNLAMGLFPDCVFEPNDFERFGKINHVVTNNKIELIGLRIDLTDHALVNLMYLESLGYSENDWISADKLDDFAVSSPQKKLIQKYFVLGEIPRLRL